MTKTEISEIYLETMKQMDIDFYNETELIKKLKSNKLISVEEIQNSLSSNRESFLSKYSWTIVPAFFEYNEMRKDYLNSSSKRCRNIYDEIYNS